MMKLPDFPPDYRRLEIFRPDRAPPDSVPLAVLKARLNIASSTKPVCGCDSLSSHRLAFLLTIRDTVGFYGRSLNPGNYPTPHRLEQRRRGGAGTTYAFNPSGTASSGQTLHGGRAPGAHSANHGAGQRGLSAAD